MATAGADRSARALDLGSGPGTAALELASRVGSVVAVDLDPDMVAEGRRLADAAGVRNLEWVSESSGAGVAAGLVVGAALGVIGGAAAGYATARLHDHRG